MKTPESNAIASTCSNFDSRTLFTSDQDTIILRQASRYIAKGTLSEWIQLFHVGEQSASPNLHKPISKTLEMFFCADSTWMMIQDPSCDRPEGLKIHQKNLHKLEKILIELNQGCSDPVPFNLVADIIEDPDEILRLIQRITGQNLSLEQLTTAKISIEELPTELEPTVSDLYKLWKKMPNLSFFAKKLRFYFSLD